MVPRLLVVTALTRPLYGLHVQNDRVHGSVAGHAVGSLLLLLLLDDVSEVIALAEALVDVVVTPSASGGDVLAIDGAPRGQTSGDFDPVCFFLVAGVGVSAVAIFTTDAFLTVNG